MIDRMLRINNLLDFYRVLLTERQNDVMEMYYQEDFSLGEIAENLGISRQAVYDQLQRTENLMEDYESKLQLIAQFTRRINLLNQLDEELDNKDIEKAKDIIQKLRE